MSALFLALIILSGTLGAVAFLREGRGSIAVSDQPRASEFTITESND
jgi:hypothetical protein